MSSPTRSRHEELTIVDSSAVDCPSGCDWCSGLSLYSVTIYGHGFAVRLRNPHDRRDICVKFSFSVHALLTLDSRILYG